MEKYELVIFNSFGMLKNCLFLLYNGTCMIFIDKNISPLIMKLFVLMSCANTRLHKRFGTILIILNWLINLSV
jgi:hypothetical protein